MLQYSYGFELLGPKRFALYAYPECPALQKPKFKVKDCRWYKDKLLDKTLSLECVFNFRDCWAEFGLARDYFEAKLTEVVGLALDEYGKCLDDRPIDHPTTNQFLCLDLIQWEMKTEKTAMQYDACTEVTIPPQATFNGKQAVEDNGVGADEV
ncbi:hypothetical protein ACH5RR_029674 [Cinchona calisaya]|uniref:Uncharacterized protein n=1 Tax=Cinchona calisaya TaxID=153742 RepID=A0ABD2YXJ9_9GENT